jgi:Uma2 family endonuclease
MLEVILRIEDNLVVIQTTQLPLRGLLAGFRKFSIDEYHKLIEIGLLTENDNLELLEGYLVLKMSRNPPHDGTIDLVREVLFRLIPLGWMLRVQQAITLADSEPEPDFAIVRGNSRSFLQRHPLTDEIAVCIEVSESTLESDQIDKGRIYARAGIPIYWIVNLMDRRIEVYSIPNSASLHPEYTQRQYFGLQNSVPLMINQQIIANIPVVDLLP